MSFWDSAGDFFGKVVDGYVEVETANAEASQPQVPASVGVTEPVTQPATTTTATGVPVTTGTTLDNKTMMMIGGGAFALLLLVVLLKK